VPKYKVTNEDVQVYPSLGITVSPGDVVELAEEVNAIGLELVVESTKKTKE
jgi:hypothetical protein